MTAAAGGTVLVAATNAVKAAPYVAALAAAGVPAGSIRVVTPAGAPAQAGAGAATSIGGPAASTTAAASAVSGAPAGGAGAPTPPAAVQAPATAVAPASRERDVAELAAGATGLVLCGGDDVDPGRYGEALLPDAGVEPVPERDALEWELLAAARARRLPVWAVCRGFQVLNVFFGGTLWQDLPLQRPSATAHDPGPPSDRLAHAVRLLAPQAPIGERLAAAGPAPRVNSRHHQGVKRLAAGLLAVAAAEDGLIEAAVLADGSGGAGAAGGDGWWVRGVEWHPENLLALPEQLALWHDFAAAVSGFAASRRPGGGTAAGGEA
ncbi:MAG TPA: gamma-glutamyl-gamma-aminobutyrate hydrolase family protein [Thermoanaerobaculia bacterium]|nr:gamma-glutamyl-gamma-aminobutyrate hydrolase family protein [Thermoanaerobaculia bacterium]